jgi:hypothetical protein
VLFDHVLEVCKTLAEHIEVSMQKHKTPWRHWRFLVIDTLDDLVGHDEGLEAIETDLI